MAAPAVVHPPTEAPDAEAEEAGRLLFAQACEFMAGAGSDDTIPPGDDLPEIAFAGRSNVGKSSLVNALTGRRTPRPSSTCSVCCPSRRRSISTSCCSAFP